MLEDHAEMHRWTLQVTLALAGLVVHKLFNKFPSMKQSNVCLLSVALKQQTLRYTRS